MGSLVTLQVILLLGYSIFLVGLGLWIGRRVRTSGDFFVAGRRLGPGLLFATMLAANVGAGSTVGASALGYRDGLSAWWWVGSAGIGSIVLAGWIGPRIRRLAAEHDLRTVGDYLELRYGRSVRGATASLLWVGTLAILAGQLIALASVLEVVAGIPKAAGCLIGGVVMMTYFVAGGLLTAAWVNLVQLVVLMVGFVVAVPLALESAGGWSVLASTHATDPGYWSFWGGGGSGWAYVTMLGPAFIVSPGLLQKTYGARDDRTVRIGIGLNAAMLLLFAFVPTILGMTARTLHPSLANDTLALPTLLMYDLPAVAGGLALAALFSAEVSTCDAILFMLATSLSQDLYRGYINPTATDGRILRVARGAAIVGGGLGVALAIVSPSVIGALSIFYTLLSVSLFVPILAGLFTRVGGAPEALAAIGTGVVTVLAAPLLSPASLPVMLTPAFLGIVAAGAAFGITLGARQRLRS